MIRWSNWVLMFFMIISVIFSQEKDKTVKIGILSGNVKEDNFTNFQYTADYLDSALTDYKVVLIPLSFDKIEDSIKNNAINFVFLNPSFFVSLQKKHKILPLATLINHRDYRQSAYFGSVIFTNTSNGEKFADFKGKKLAIINKESFGGWFIAKNEMLKNGFDPSEECSEIVNCGSFRKVIEAVKNRKCDFGVVRTGVLEKFQEDGLINIEDIKVINQDLNLQSKLKFKLLLSTKLYPEWVFAKLAQTDHVLAKKMLHILMNISENSYPAIMGGYSGFTVPLNYNDVETCLVNLNKLTIDNSKSNGFGYNYKEYKIYRTLFLITVFILIIIIVIALVYNKIGLEYKNKISEDLKEKESLIDRLKSETDKVKLLLNFTRCGILLVDKDNKIIEVNSRLFELINLPQDEIIKEKDFNKLLLKWCDFNNIIGEQRKKILSITNVVSERSIVYNANDKYIEIINNPIEDGAFIRIFIDVTKQKQCEERYRLITESVTDIIWNIDKDLNFIFVSPSIEQLTGYTVEEYLSKKLYDVIAPESFSVINNLVDKAFTDFSSVKGTRTEFQHISKDGTISYYETSIDIVLNDDGSLKYYAGVSRNIDEKKKAIRELTESEEKFRLVVEQSPLGILIIDKEYRITKANKASCEFLHYQEHEIVNLNYFQILSSEEISKDKKIIERFIKGENVGITEFRFLTSKLNTAWGKVSVASIKGDGNEPLYYVHIIEDITDLKRTENYLKETDLQFREVWENSFDGMRLTDNNGIIVLVNKAFCKLVKKENHELIGQPFSVIYAYEEQASILAKGQEKIVSRSVQDNFERELTLWNNEKVWFELSNSFIKVESQPKLLLSIFHDITKRKKAEEELLKYSTKLEEANKSKDKFFSIISHDLKSPFQASLGISELLVTEIDSLKRSEIVEFANGLNKTLKNQYNLLQTLLDWSRLQTGRISYHPVSFQIYEIAQNVIELLAVNLSNKNIKIVNDIETGVMVMADKNMIHMVLQNLVANAIKFTNFNGLIKIISKKYDDVVEISVTDTGVGISETDIQKLFRIDCQHSTKGTNKESGTGLGLILCKEMVERNKGSIGVESKLDIGSRFYFTLNLS